MSKLIDEAKQRMLNLSEKFWPCYLSDKQLVEFIESELRMAIEAAARECENIPSFIPANKENGMALVVQGFGDKCATRIRELLEGE